MCFPAPLQRPRYLGAPGSLVPTTSPRGLISIPSYTMHSTKVKNVSANMSSHTMG
ncbi:hypothetical protein C8Q78DRAFT_1053383 [Trametes maxima]|nr:hypothetical protein C8Q78DRAFT_1053383 [Trametes maxima]